MNRKEWTDDKRIVKDLKHLEESILSIIAKIKKDRNRACIQNIHAFIKRRGIAIGVEKLKEVIENLMLRNIIVDRGREGKESFLVVNLLSENEEKVDDTQSGSEHETSLNDLHEFIDVILLSYVTRYNQKTKL